MTTSVYLIAEPPAPGSPLPFGPVKIGVATDPERRLKSLQTGNPRALILLGLFGTFPDRKDALRAEGELHARFSGDRMAGEWFRPSPPLAAFARGHLTGPAFLPRLYDGLIPCPDCGGEPYTPSQESGVHFTKCIRCSREAPARPTWQLARDAWNARLVGAPAAKGFQSHRPNPTVFARRLGDVFAFEAQA